MEQQEGHATYSESDVPQESAKNESSKLRIPSYIFIGLAVFLFVLLALFFIVQNTNLQRDGQTETDQLSDNQAPRDDADLEQGDYIKNVIPMEAMSFDTFLSVANQTMFRSGGSGPQSTRLKAGRDEFYKEIVNDPAGVIDERTFQIYVLKENSSFRDGYVYLGFAKDKNHYYFHKQVIEGVTPDKFQLVKTGNYDALDGRGYSRKGGGSYGTGEHYFFVSDNEIYYYGYVDIAFAPDIKKPKKIEGADPDTFHLIAFPDSSSYDFYAADESNVYLNDKKLPVAPENVKFTYVAETNPKIVDRLVDTTTGDEYYRNINVTQLAASADKTIARDTISLVSPTKDFRAATTSDGTRVVKNYSTDSLRYSLGIFDAQTDNLLIPSNATSSLAGYDILGFSPNEDYLYYFNALYEFASYSSLYRMNMTTGIVEMIPGIEGLNRWSATRSVVSGDRTKILLPDSKGHEPPTCYADLDQQYTTVKLIDLAAGRVKTVFDTSEPIQITDLNVTSTNIEIVYDTYLLTENTDDYDKTTEANEKCALTTRGALTNEYQVQYIQDPL